MPNHWSNSGAPMVQSTNDELRAFIAEQRNIIAAAKAEIQTLKAENSRLKKRLALAEGLVGEKLLDVVAQQLARG
jgi:cell shape-determining protein MreC